MGEAVAVEVAGHRVSEGWGPGTTALSHVPRPPSAPSPSFPTCAAITFLPHVSRPPSVPSPSFPTQAPFSVVMAWWRARRVGKGGDCALGKGGDDIG
jgi:hypothetical protein